MFFDVCLMLILLLQPFCLYLAYKVGRDEKILIKPVLKGKEKSMTKEEKINLEEWKNILNYDGTKESQEEIDC